MTGAENKTPPKFRRGPGRGVPECAECQVPRALCPDCSREMADEHDEGNCNTGACGCKKARALCWRTWNGRCLPVSVYDSEAGEINAKPLGRADEGER